MQLLFAVIADIEDIDADNKVYRITNIKVVFIKLNFTAKITSSQELYVNNFVFSRRSETPTHSPRRIFQTDLLHERLNFKKGT